MEFLPNVRHIARCAPRASNVSPPRLMTLVLVYPYCVSMQGRLAEAGQVGIHLCNPGTHTTRGERAGKGAGGKVARAGLSPADLIVREDFKQERDWTAVCLGQVDEAESTPGRGTSLSRGMPVQGRFGTVSSYPLASKRQLESGGGRGDGGRADWVGLNVHGRTGRGGTLEVVGKDTRTGCKPQTEAWTVLRPGTQHWSLQWGYRFGFFALKRGKSWMGG